MFSNVFLGFDFFCKCIHVSPVGTNIVVKCFTLHIVDTGSEPKSYFLEFAGREDNGNISYLIFEEIKIRNRFFALNDSDESTYSVLIILCIGRKIIQIHVGLKYSFN